MKTLRDKKGRFNSRKAIIRLVFGIIMGLILAYLAVKLGKILFPNNYHFVSPVAEAKQENFKVKFIEGNIKTPEMQVINMIVSEFEEFGPRVTMQALKIADCESKFNEEAVHVNKTGSVDRGIFQINSVHKYSEYQLLAAYENIKIAKQMYLKNGKSWGAWVCKAN